MVDLEATDASREIQQLREKVYAPVQGSHYQLPMMSVRIIKACFDIQRMHGLSAEKMLAGMAIALAEALDNAEKLNLDRVMMSPPPSIVMCAECPKLANLKENR